VAQSFSGKLLLNLLTVQTPVIFVNTPVFYVEKRCFKVVAKVTGGIGLAISPFLHGLKPFSAL
jgi:hypothetical protein